MLNEEYVVSRDARVPMQRWCKSDTLLDYLGRECVIAKGRLIERESTP
jgi:hypothetical protein